MLKIFLTKNINLIEIVFIALSAVSAFMSSYIFISEKSARSLIKLIKIRKINRRVKNEKKKG